MKPRERSSVEPDGGGDASLTTGAPPFFGVGGKQREINALAIPGGAKRIGMAWPYASAGGHEESPEGGAMSRGLCFRRIVSGNIRLFRDKQWPLA